MRRARLCRGRHPLPFGLSWSASRATVADRNTQHEPVKAVRALTSFDITHRLPQLVFSAPSHRPRGC